MPARPSTPDGKLMHGVDYGLSLFKYVNGPGQVLDSAISDDCELACCEVDYPISAAGPAIMKSLSWALQAISVSSVLLLSVSASPSSNVFESLQELPRGWTHARSAQPDEVVRLRLSLKQQNLDRFYDSLLQVSTPGHPRYGAHYEGHELRSLLRPSAEASSTALAWLRDNNVTAVRDDGDYLYFRTTVAAADRLLDTRFGWYRSVHGEELLRTTRYAVPAHVAAHINFVQPTTRFGSTRPLASHVNVMGEGQVSDGQSKWVTVPDELKVNAASAGVNASCATSITPQCLFQLYNVNLKGSSASNNSVGYASFVGESARFTDMATFAKVYAPFAANSPNVSILFPSFYLGGHPRRQPSRRGKTNTPLCISSRW